MHAASRFLLVIAGLVASAVGAALLLDPVGFEATAGLRLPSDPALLSELRAPGGGLLASGLFMLVGAARRRYTRPAIAVAGALYLAFGLARLVGFALDGSPGVSLAIVTALEIAIGLGAVTFFRASAPAPARV